LPAVFLTPKLKELHVDALLMYYVSASYSDNGCKRTGYGEKNMKG
jgi:hypothetical protein